MQWGNNQELTKGGFKYGCGLGMIDFGGTQEIAHGGGFNGYDCWLARFDEYDLTIIVLTNCNPHPQGTGSREIVHRIASLFLD